LNWGLSDPSILRDVVRRGNPTLLESLPVDRDHNGSYRYEPAGPCILGLTGGSVLACILFFGLRVRRHSSKSVLGILVILIACASGIVACIHKSNLGTSAGTYTVTVMGTTGTVSVTSGPITLIVQ
jgi:hypothetical protein